MKGPVLTLVLITGAATALPLGSVQAGQVQTPPPATSPEATFVRQYCVSCHNERNKTSVRGLTLESLNPVRPEEHPAIWEKVVRKLRSRGMPPSGARQPDDASRDAFASGLETRLDGAARKTPTPGQVPAFRRLTRTEYQHAIRDLLAIDDLPKQMDLTTLLPADNSSTGFDNLADLLFVSPTQLEQYLAAARKISRLAIGDPIATQLNDTYQLSTDANQDVQADGAPFGTRGGAAIRTYLPADGQYRVQVRLTGTPREPHHLEVAVDGNRARLFTLPLPRDAASSPTAPEAPAQPQQATDIAARLAQSGAAIDVGTRALAEDKSLAAVTTLFQVDQQSTANRRNENAVDVVLPLKAGPRRITAAFVNRAAVLSEGIRQPSTRTKGQSRGVGIASVTITGPVNGHVSPDTPSRRRLFVCQPSAPMGEATCAKRIIATLARRAYRRPVTDDDVKPLLAFYDAGRTSGFDHGIEKALERVLVSPQFLFRIERDPSSVAKGATYRITDMELASRLSFFLWSSIPDDQLLNLAAEGRLKNPAVLEQEVQRMLRDPRSAALATNFGAQWLFLRDVATKNPSPRFFSTFDLGLRQLFQQETELFLNSIFSEDRSALELLSANYTFLNERLARHYGIPNVFGNYFRRVTHAADSPRHGLLGHGSVLLLTSYSTRTSPVLRGKWVLSNILDSPPPPPPDNVPSLVTEAKGSGKPLSMREAMAQHRSNPVCATCHTRMDPIGFALDNFDAVGRWRAVSESGAPIDASGIYPDGSKFEGPVGLRALLLKHPEEFVLTVTGRLMTYALGRSLEYYDAPTLRAISRAAAANNYRVSSLILEIVKSVPFQMRTAGRPKE